MKKIIAIIFAVVLVAFSNIPAFAVNSPVGTTVAPQPTTVAPTTEEPMDWDNLDVTNPGGGYTEDIVEIIGDDTKVIIIRPQPNPGYEFERWEIIGDYTTDGDLTDPNLKLTVTGNYRIIPIFKKKTVPGSNTDNSPSSPQTGSNDTIVYTVVLLAVAACGVATYKLAKSKKQ